MKAVIGRIISYGSEEDGDESVSGVENNSIINI